MTWSRIRSRLAVVALAIHPLVAAAQPAPQPAPADRVDAKSLMQSGLRLFGAGDYLGALAVFKDAYARFPSEKILLNIGTTLSQLGRKAEAANAYQRYADSSEADPVKRPDVLAAIADLDRAVGKLEISVTPADAEIQINDGEWEPAAAVRIYRVADGSFTVRARKAQFQGAAKSASLTIGETATITLALTPSPDPLPSGGGGGGGLRDDDLGITDPGPAPRSRFGVIALAHIDIPRRGGAARVGLGVDVTGALQLQAAALIGPNMGGYGGASFTFTDGTFRPLVAAGMPVFFSDGARIGVRGAGGLEIALTRNVSLVAELGVEVLLNPEDDILKAVFIPALGATGRL